MADIKRNNARKCLEQGMTPFPGISNHREDGGLRFQMQIGFHTVSLTHIERDMVIEQWAKQEKDFEHG